MTVKEIYELSIDYVDVRDYFTYDILFSDGIEGYDDFKKVENLEVHSISVYNEITLIIYVKIEEMWKMKDFKVGDIINSRYIIISICKTIELFDLYVAETIIVNDDYSDEYREELIHIRSCKDIINIDYTEE